MSVLDRFADAVAAAERDGLSGPELMPERLARGCLAALPVDGAGMSMLFARDRRLPLGSSDQVSADAERLQFTVGEGPCLQTHSTGRPVLATEEDLRTRWPAFYEALTQQTPYRSIVALPLRGSLTGIGALDLYLTPPHGVGDIGLQDALVVVDEITGTFEGAMTHAARRSSGPAWLDAPAATRRAHVWVALGMLNAELQVTSPTALSLLRAHAFASGRDVDELALDVVEGRVPTGELADSDDRTGS